MAKLFLLLLPLFVNAADRQIIKIYKMNNDRFRLEICEKECKALGNQSGYSKGELEAWKNFQKSSAKEIVPMMGAVAAICVIVSVGITLPLSVVIAGSIALISSSFYFFSQTNQVKIKMSNDVHHEFSIDPNLLQELKSFLSEIEQGAVITDKNPRIISTRSAKEPLAQINPEKNPTMVDQAK